MTKAKFKILLNGERVKMVDGYIFDVPFDNSFVRFGVHRIASNSWNLTHIETGLCCTTEKTRKACVDHAFSCVEHIVDVLLYDIDTYNYYIYAMTKIQSDTHSDL